MGSLATALVPTAEQLIPIITAHGGVVHPISDDGRYGLDLTPLFESLNHAITHRDSSILFSTINRNELQLTGSYLFDPISRSLAVKLFLFNDDELLFQSGSIDIYHAIETAIPHSDRLFDRGFNEEKLCVQGVISDRINSVIRSGTLPDILLKARSFRVVGRSGNATLSWDEIVFVQWLENQFGTTLSSTAQAKMIFTNDGSVTFRLGSQQQTVRAVLPAGDPAIENASSRDGYLTAVEQSNRFRYERVQPELPIENKIMDTISTFFGETYPALFTRFSSQQLLSLFPQQNERSVLAGAVISATEVRYQWLTPQNWVNRLEQLHRSGRQFNVQCEVREIIQDPHSPYRFWAVVDQKWRTRNSNGEELYSDRGFLLVNFDFGTNGSLQNVALHYRLWFYNYPFQIANDTHFSRQSAITRDVTMGLSNVHGVDSSLKEQVKESLLRSF